MEFNLKVTKAPFPPEAIEIPKEEEGTGVEEEKIEKEAQSLAKVLKKVEDYTPPANAYKAGSLTQVLMGRGKKLVPNKYGYFIPSNEEEEKRLAYLYGVSEFYLSPVSGKEKKKG